MSTDLALKSALMWYACSIYPVFERIGAEQTLLTAQAAADWSLEYPLWMKDEHGRFPTRDLPHFGVRSSVFAIAVQASYLVWTLKQLDSPLPVDSDFLKACAEGYQMYVLFKRGPDLGLGRYEFVETLATASAAEPESPEMRKEID
jgi:hypothetical protein